MCSLVILVKTHILVVLCVHRRAPVCTLLIQVMIASSVSYGSSWMCLSLCEGSAEEYLLMQDITLSTLIISTVYAIISVSMSARWELCGDIQYNRVVRIDLTLPLFRKMHKSHDSRPNISVILHIT